MKLMMRLILCLGIASPLVFGTQSVGTEQVKDKIFFLAHQRSGGTWMQYCLKHLLGDRFHWMSDLMHWSLLLKGKPYPYDKLAKSPIKLWISHFHQAISPIPSQQNKLLFVVRNYREIISRWMTVGRPHWNYDFYLKHLKTYDQWDPQNRHLYYYEDFILYPRETLKKILDFFEVSDERLDDFMANLEKHKIQSLKEYDSLFKGNVKGSVSRGKSVVYHSKKISEAKLREMDKLMKHYAGCDLYDKYLSRYELK